MPSPNCRRNGIFRPHVPCPPRWPTTSTASQKGFPPSAPTFSLPRVSLCSTLPLSLSGIERGCIENKNEGRKGREKKAKRMKSQIVTERSLRANPVISSPFCLGSFWTAQKTAHTRVTCCGRSQHRRLLEHTGHTIHLNSRGQRQPSGRGHPSQT